MGTESWYSQGAFGLSEIWEVKHTPAPPHLHSVSAKAHFTSEVMPYGVLGLSKVQNPESSGSYFEY